MSCGDSYSYALQSRLNAPNAAASDGTKQWRLLLDNWVDFIQRELSVLGSWRVGVEGWRWAANWRSIGRSVRHVCEVWSGVTSFNSCPNPELETTSLLQWHRIRLVLTRSYSHLQRGSSFPCYFPTSQFLIAKRITHLWQPKCSALPTASNQFLMKCQITEPTSARIPIKFCVGSLEYYLNQSSSNPSAYRLTAQKQHSVISVRIVLSCPAILFTALLLMVLLPAETLGTSCFIKTLLSF